MWFHLSIWINETLTSVFISRTHVFYKNIIIRTHVFKIWCSQEEHISSTMWWDGAVAIAVANIIHISPRTWVRLLLGAQPHQSTQL